MKLEGIVVFTNEEIYVFKNRKDYESFLKTKESKNIMWLFHSVKNLHKTFVHNDKLLEMTLLKLEKIKKAMEI